MSTLIGLDSSTKCSGISVFVDGKLKGYELVTVNGKSTSQWERLDPMMKGISNILDRFNPDVVYHEESWKGRNVDTLKCLTNIMGGVRFWCLQHQSKYVTIYPAEWRKVLGLNKFKAERDELKTIAKQYIKDKYKIDIPTDDVSDSICIGLAALEIERISV